MAFTKSYFEILTMAKGENMSECTCGFKYTKSL